MNAQQYLNRGLGCTPQLGNLTLPDSVVNYKIPIPDSPAPTTGGNFWSGLNNFFSNLNKTATTLAPVASQVKSTVDLFKNNQTLPGYTPGQLPGAPAPQQSNLLRNVLIGVGVAGAGFLAYQAFKPSK